MLHQSTLDHLHILLKFAWDSRALLTLVLVGLPELADRPQLRHNRALETRLVFRRKIAPLSFEDTAEYLRFRLQTAGSKGEIFARDAVVYLREATQGLLRDLDRLAAAALDLAAARGSVRVERDIIQMVVAADKQYQQQ